MILLPRTVSSFVPRRRRRSWCRCAPASPRARRARAARPWTPWSPWRAALRPARARTMCAHQPEWLKVVKRQDYGKEIPSLRDTHDTPQSHGSYARTDHTEHTIILSRPVRRASAPAPRAAPRASRRARRAPPRSMPRVRRARPRAARPRWSSCRRARRAPASA